MTINRAYRSHQVQGAGPLGLVLLTYDALIRNLNFARDAAIAADYAAQADYSMQAVSALLELISSLDHEAGGQVASSLGSMYAYMYRRLMESQTGDTIDAMTEVMALAETLREGWQGLSDQQQPAAQRQFTGAVA
jgi:flagellar protein FliS